MSFLLTWSLRTALAILLGLGLSLALRRCSAAARSLVLRITLAAAWLIPLATLVAPRIEVSLPTTVVAPRATPIWEYRPGPVTKGWSVVQPDPQDVSSVGFVRQTPFSTEWVPLVSPAFGVWAVGAGILVLRWLVAFERLRRIARSGEWAEFAGLKSGVPMRTEVRAPKVFLGDVSVPMTYGRTILLPREAADWPESRVRAALLHEMAHVRRGDWAWQTLAALFCAVHWANPFAWMLAHALRNTAEAAADDEAIQGMSPSDYARELLAVASRARASGPALAMARRGGVRDRVMAVLAIGRDRRQTSRWTALVALPLAFTGIALAGIVVAKPEGTRSVHLKNGIEVRLVSVQEAFNQAVRPAPKALHAWTADGQPLPDVPVRYPVGLVDEPRDSGYRPLEFQVRAFDGNRPTEVAVYAYDSVRQRRWSVGGPRQAVGDRFGWSVREGVAAEDMRIAVAAGEWMPYHGPDVTFKASRQRVHTIMGWETITMVHFPVPTAITGKNVRVFARLLNGRRVKVGEHNALGTPTVRTRFMSSNEIHPNLDPHAVRRIEFETRDYEVVTFPSVALRPRTVARRKAEPDQVGDKAIQLDSLYDLAQSSILGWTSDGKRGPRASAIDFRQKTDPDKRRITLRFRLHGPIAEPELIASAENSFSKGTSTFTFIDATAFQPGWVPGETLAWGTFQIGRWVRTTQLNVELATGAWTVHAVMAPGDGPGQATVEPYGPGVRVTPHGIARPGPGRRIELLAYDAQGQPLGTLRTSEDQSSYLFPVAEGRRAARWTLRSRPIHAAGFRNVALYPSP